MTRVGLAALLISALPVSPSASDTVAAASNAAGTSTPTLGPGIDGAPGLTDVEPIGASLAFTPDKSIATVTWAPFFQPGAYHPLYSEVRVAAFAETSGAFGMGVGWSYNGTRRPVALPSAPVDTGGADARDAALRPLVAALCRMLTGAAPSGWKRRATLDDACTPEKEPGAAARTLVSMVDKLRADVPDLSPDADALAATASRVVDAREEEGVAALKKAAAKLQKEVQAELDARYEGAFIFTVYGTGSLFTVFSGPDIAPKDDPTAPRNGAAERWRDVDAGASLRLFANRNLVFQLHGGWRRERASPAAGSLPTNRTVVGADLGWFHRTGEPDADGFVPGIGAGLDVAQERCAAAGGCQTSVASPDPEYPEKLPLDRRLLAQAFVEARIASKLQVRFGVQYRRDAVHGTIPRTAGEANPVLQTWLPVLAVGSSYWGL